MQDIGKKRLDISIDPGYDGTKVTVNGDTFDIPKKTVKKIGNEYEAMGALEGIYEITLPTGKFLCGPNISVMLDDNKEFHERYDKGAEQSGNYSYFATQEFVANTLSALSIAFIKASSEGLLDLDDIDASNIYLIVELPHEALESMSKTVTGSLVGEHDITFKTDIAGAGKEYHLSFTINENRLLIMSQVIACLIGYMTDENGREIDSLKDAYPAVVIDGGYYTVGDSSISKTKAISGAKSNTNFGMKIIHERTAEAINKECQTKFKYYDMDNLFNEEGGKVIIPRNISKSGNNEVVDVNKILKKITQEVFDEYLAYLEEKYAYFTKTKLILFGGGTGKIYYELFCKVADKYPNVEARLVTYQLNGKDITPREAISAGGYKTLLNQLKR